LLLVSHDRHLLRATSDTLWLVHDGRLASFDGDLDDYAALVLASRREERDIDSGETARDDDARKRKDLRKQEAEERQRLASARKPLQSQLQKVEKELAPVSAELRELDSKLADPSFYHDGDAAEVAAVLKRRGELALKVEALEERWLQLQAELEAIT
jgi:ATP-binding cassette subfamily F protein 3